MEILADYISSSIWFTFTMWAKWMECRTQGSRAALSAGSVTASWDCLRAAPKCSCWTGLWESSCVLELNEIVISIYRELKPAQQPEEQKRTDKKTSKPSFLNYTLRTNFPRKVNQIWQNLVNILFKNSFLIKCTLESVLVLSKLI